MKTSEIVNNCIVQPTAVHVIFGHFLAHFSAKLQYFQPNHVHVFSIYDNHKTYDLWGKIF